MCSINNLNIKFSFIVLSEIWGDSNDAMLNVIPGYSHIYDIRESRNGGGVSIYVVDCINYKKRLDLKVLEKCTKNLIGHSRLAFTNHESNIDC